MTEKSGRKRLAAFLAVALLLVVVSGIVAAGCGGSDLPSAGGTDTTASTATSTTGVATSTSEATLSANLNGAGATFPEPLYVEWIGEFQIANPDVTINYQGIGSGGGIEQFTKLTVDFGASDAPMKDEEITAAEAAGGAKVLHIPTVFGAVVLAYNLDGIDELKLDPDTLAAIFLGSITRWNDAKIIALNPGVTLPDKSIQVVHRSDSSGTTNIFTGYLTQISTEWANKVGKGKEVQWPVGIGGQGNDGVAAVVQQQAGSIGYVELSYATESGLAMTILKNKAGNFVTPSLESTSAAAVGVTFPDDLRFSVSNSDGAQAYPIVGATWILVFEKMKGAAEVEALKAWLTWSLNGGTAIAQELGYAPLSEELKALTLAKIDSISSF
ncbi:MAG: phosphate ABC transporter substrate-binding protein PstS [Actinobacteria bacterium RBG_16_64_13]|nr:MAG: phosphate ABC transporter substrate-binding protein PstS [Actinobacteria bacterium RBG_16_64_13]